jgi:predicted HTH domain antitoxin
MAETGVLIQLPAPLLEFGFDESEIQNRVTEWLVLSLFTEGRVSSGKAARLLNISRVDFLALLRARGIAYLNYSAEELKEEFAAARHLPDGKAA